MLRVLLIAVLVFTSSFFASAQDDILTTTYGEVVVHEFTPESTQAFIQFSGEAEDLVYVLVEMEEIAFGSELEIDLRDSVGRSVGFKDEFSFDPFILAELPISGTYTVVVTFTHDENNIANILVDNTTYLSSEPTLATINSDGFNVLFGVRVEHNGLYELELIRNGQLAVSFTIRDFDGFIPTGIVSLDGSSVQQWSVQVDMVNEGNYIAFLSPSFFRQWGDEMSEVEITLSKIE